MPIGIDIDRYCIDIVCLIGMLGGNCMRDNNAWVIGLRIVAGSRRSDVVVPCF